MGTIGLRFPPASGTDPQQHAAQLALLASDVAHIPPEFLDRASRDWAAKSPYMPKASELIELAQTYVKPDPALANVAAYVASLNSTRTRQDVEWFADAQGLPRLRFVKTDFDNWIDQISEREPPQWQIDNKPDQWKRVAVERGFLTRLTHPDGTFAGYEWRVPFDQRQAA